FRPALRVYPYLDDLYSRLAATHGLSGYPRDAGAFAFSRAGCEGRSSLRSGRGAQGRGVARCDLSESRGAGTLPDIPLRRPAPIRRGDAGGGVRVVRPMALEGMRRDERTSEQSFEVWTRLRIMARRNR